MDDDVNIRTVMCLSFLGCINCNLSGVCMLYTSVKHVHDYVVYSDLQCIIFILQYSIGNRIVDNMMIAVRMLMDVTKPAPNQNIVREESLLP